MLGNRIKQARTAAGLTTRALAERIGVSAMAISKYETGKSVPSSGVLLKLAAALGVRTEFFFREAQVELEAVEYRKHASLGKRLQEQIQAEVVEQIERWQELESYLVSAPIVPFELPPALPKNIDASEAIEDVALAVREAWDLGINPIPDLTDTLEERGIKVLQAEALHDHKFDGLAAVVGSVPVIVVGKDWPGDRQRFTLAHELGHLMLDGRLSDDLDKEKAAHRFAGAFLVPASEVRKELGEHRTWLEPGELHVLKLTYGLSMGAWLYRARDTGVLSEAGFQEMFRFFSAQGWRKTEPGAGYPREEPKLFEQLVFRALAEDLVTEAKAAELMRLPLTQFRAKRALTDDAPADQ